MSDFAEAVENRGTDDLKREVQALKSARKHDEAVLADLRQKLDLVTAIDAARLRPPKWLAPRKPTKDHRGTVCLLLTDPHFGEVVNPLEIEGLNAYNDEIAALRLRAFTDHGIGLARDYVSGITYDGCVLFIGGDVFTGTIHEELLETNSETLYASVVRWLDPLAAMLYSLADTFGRLHVAVTYGNHGRRTRKPRAKLRAQDNIEWLMYKVLERSTRPDKRITWQIPDSADTHVTVGNTRYLLTHGDQFRGGSGISGAMCLGPDSRVLCADLAYRKISDLAVGDEIIGFDEFAPQRRKFRPSIVESLDRIVRPSIEVETSAGTVMASEEHLWLVAPKWGKDTTSLTWKATKDLRLGDSIRSLGKPWNVDKSWNAGWLAGMFDGEGYVGNAGRLGIAQSFTHNPDLCERIGNALTDYGFAFEVGRRDDVGVLNFRGTGNKRMVNNLRLLGTIRPHRMIAQAAPIWNGVAVNAAENAEVTGLRRVGDQEVVTVGTSTRTLIVEGLLSHNSPLLLGAHRKTRRAMSTGRLYDWMVMGHFHSFMRFPGVIVGGSLKGTDEYSYLGNFGHDEPSGTFWITTPERGVMFLEKVAVMDRAAEGW